MLKYHHAHFKGEVIWVTNQNATVMSASRDEGMVRPTIGQMLGNRTVKAILSEARHDMRVRHLLSMDEIEMAYHASGNAMCEVLLTAAKKMSGSNKVYFYDLAGNEGDYIEMEA